MTTLIITLPLAALDAATLFDHVLSTDGQTVNAHASVPLALLPATHDDVVALVPAQALSWHQVKLPQGSLPRTLGGERANARLRSILEGVLEDQLLDDPAQMHLALQPQASTTAPVWVAACDRTWLSHALNVLAQAGHVVTRIVPEFTPQALQDVMVVTGEADAPRVAGLRHLPGEGADSALLVTGLTSQTLLWLTGPGTLPQDTPSHPPSEWPTVVAEPAVAAVAERLFQRPVVLVQHAERLLQAAQSPWDLAQFDLAHAARDRRWASVAQAFIQFGRAPHWRIARIALVAVVLVNLIGLNAFALREQAALNAKRQAVRAVLQDTFPKVPVVVDAPVQMASEVAALQRASGTASGTDMETILASFSAVAPAEYAPVAIEYTANELRLKGPGVADEAAVVAQLKAAGLRASQQGDQWLITAGGQP